MGGAGQTLQRVSRYKFVRPCPCLLISLSQDRHKSHYVCFLLMIYRCVFIYINGFDVTYRVPSDTHFRDPSAPVSQIYLFVLSDVTTDPAYSYLTNQSNLVNTRSQGNSTSGWVIEIIHGTKHRNSCHKKNSRVDVHILATAVMILPLCC